MPRTPEGFNDYVAKELIAEDKRMDERFDALEKLIKSGFPDGNPEEHRKVHERYIKDAKEREEVRLAVKKSLYSSGIWLAILTLLAALASFFGIEVRK